MMKTLTILTAAICLVLVAGDHNSSTEVDAFCHIVNIFLNPVALECQALMENDSDAFCRSNCSELLAQAFFDCGDSQYLEIKNTCVRDPTHLQFCRKVEGNETILANLNASCSGNDSCSRDCQAAVDNIGCCAKYVESDVSLSQCNIDYNCTTVQLNTSKAEALNCYRSHLHKSFSLNECHKKLIASTISQNSTITTSFCDGNCPAQVANLYSECGLSSFASIVRNGCERDERNRYCGNVVHPSLNPEWEVLVDKAIVACKEEDCSRDVCRIAINNIGCCLALDVEVNATISTLLPISGCDIQNCSADSSTVPLCAIPTYYVLLWTLLASVLLELL